jgi:hypothetical protein
MKNLCRDMNLSEFRISEMIIDVCSKVKDQFEGNDFAIICKADFEEGKVKILPDYQIPRQTIKGSYIYFDSDHIDELKSKGYTFLIRICSNKSKIKNRGRSK